MVKAGSYFKYTGRFKAYTVEVKAVGKIDEIWVDDCFAPDKGELTHEQRYNTTWVRFAEARDGEVFDQYATLEDFLRKAVPCEEPEGRKIARLAKEDPGLVQDCRCGGAGACMECNPRMFYNGPISR
jgi:hypothetical protein